MRIPTRLPTKYVIPLFIVAIIGTTAATMTLFTHTFPIVKTVAPPPIITTTCSTLANETAAPVQGSSGNITFGCGVPGVAFQNNPSGGVVTPTFSLGSGYTNLFLWQQNNGEALNPAPLCTGALTLKLQSGVSVTFPSDTMGPPGWDYCAEFTSAPATNFGTFTVTWTQ